MVWAALALSSTGRNGLHAATACKGQETNEDFQGGKKVPGQQLQVAEVKSVAELNERVIRGE